MRGKDIMFFSTVADIEPILQYLEKRIDVHYFDIDVSDEKNITHYSSISEFPNLGFTSNGFWLSTNRYLIIPKEEWVNVTRTPLNSGGVNFSIDQSTNPNSIEFITGGIFKKKPEVLVGGRVATISESAYSQEIYRITSWKIRKEFKNIRGNYVGKNAEKLLRLGWRLVTNEQSPKEYDLALD